MLLSFFHVNGSIYKQSKKLKVEPNRANRNTLKANFLLRVDYFFSQKIRKTEKFLQLEGSRFRYTPYVIHWWIDTCGSGACQIASAAPSSQCTSLARRLLARKEEVKRVMESGALV